ncbi:MAG: hypothetical protein J7K04_14425, partial [Spirochaetales bacterium]|nr:hypothetical protein [Spirochaetales bacterium]
AIILQKKLWKINEIFQKYGLSACIKAGLEIQGFPVGDPIPPLAPVKGIAKEEIKKVILSMK